jgi:hypothetical protein
VARRRRTPRPALIPVTVSGDRLNHDSAGKLVPANIADNWLRLGLVAATIALGLLTGRTATPDSR